MKANSTKRKIFDAVDLLTEDTSSQMPVKTMKGGVTMLDIDSIKPFHNHPFHLYEGDRLDDMVESIRDHGILNPVIVREIDDGYEMLSGHNRQKAAKIAGLKKIPAIIKYDLPDTCLLYTSCFRKIIEKRNPPTAEPMVAGNSGFLYFDKNGSICYSLHWEHYFQHIIQKYNNTYKVQMPVITPHVCRHTYCSNMAKAGMNPKTLQYRMGHSDISVTMNVYTHIGFDDAEEELKRMEEFRKAQAEIEQKKEKPMSQKMFKAI